MGSGVFPPGCGWGFRLPGAWFADAGPVDCRWLGYQGLVDRVGDVAFQAASDVPSELERSQRVKAEKLGLTRVRALGGAHAGEHLIAADVDIVKIGTWKCMPCWRQVQWERFLPYQVSASRCEWEVRRVDGAPRMTAGLLDEVRSNGSCLVPGERERLWRVRNIGRDHPHRVTHMRLLRGGRVCWAHSSQWVVRATA